MKVIQSFSWAEFVLCKYPTSMPPKPSQNDLPPASTQPSSRRPLPHNPQPRPRRLRARVQRSLERLHLRPRLVRRRDRRARGQRVRWAWWVPHAAANAPAAGRRELYVPERTDVWRESAGVSVAGAQCRYYEWTEWRSRWVCLAVIWCWRFVTHQSFGGAFA